MTDEGTTGQFRPAPSGSKAPPVCGDAAANFTEQLIAYGHVAFHANGRSVTAWLTGSRRRTELHIAVATLVPHQHSWSRWPLRASARESSASILSYLEHAADQGRPLPTDT